MIKDITKTLHNNCNAHNKCSKCGECCTPFIPITNEEAYIISDYIIKNKIQEMPLLEKKDEHTIDSHIQCPFFDYKNHKCNIYEVRPEVCRKFLCSNSNKTIKKRRKYYDKRAEINGNTGVLMPLDLLFYGNPMRLIFLIVYLLEPNNLEEAKLAFHSVGRDDVFDLIVKENQLNVLEKLIDKRLSEKASRN